jgi:hypothetical protein
MLLLWEGGSQVSHDRPSISLAHPKGHHRRPGPSFGSCVHVDPGKSELLLDLKDVSVKMTFRYPKSRLVLSGLVTRARQQPRMGLARYWSHLEPGDARL